MCGKLGSCRSSSRDDRQRLTHQRACHILLISLKFWLIGIIINWLPPASQLYFARPVYLSNGNDKVSEKLLGHMYTYTPNLLQPQACIYQLITYSWLFGQVKQETKLKYAGLFKTIMWSLPDLFATETTSSNCYMNMQLELDQNIVYLFNSFPVSQTQPNERNFLQRFNLQRLMWIFWKYTKQIDDSACSLRWI